MKLFLSVLLMSSAFIGQNADVTPQITLLVNGRHLSHYTTTEGSGLNLTCLVKEVNAHLVKFHKDKKTIQTEDFNFTQFQETKTYSSIYVIPEVTWKDEGKYICQAGGESEDVLTLRVEYSPKLLSKTGFTPNFVVSPGDDIRFTFNISASPSSTSTVIRWKNETSDLIRTEFQRTETFNVSHMNITEEETGEYEILITNSLGNLKLNYTISIDETETAATTGNETRSENEARPTVDYGTISSHIEKTIAYAVSSFTIAVLILILLALIFRCSCVRRCSQNLPCNKSKIRNPRLWVTLPSDDLLNEEINRIVAMETSRSNLDQDQLPTEMKPANSLNDLININIDIKNYRDSGLL